MGQARGRSAGDVNQALRGGYSFPRLSRASRSCRVTTSTSFPKAPRRTLTLPKSCNSVTSPGMDWNGPDRKTTRSPISRRAVMTPSRPKGSNATGHNASQSGLFRPVKRFFPRSPDRHQRSPHSPPPQPCLHYVAAARRYVFSYKYFYEIVRHVSSTDWRTRAFRIDGGGLRVLPRQRLFPAARPLTPGTAYLPPNAASWRAQNKTR